MKNKLIFCVIVIILTGGCTSITVRPVTAELNMKHVCIADGKDTCWDAQVLGVIRDGFERNGITSQVYSGKLPPECEFNLSYMCERSWDFATYMTHAEIRVQQGHRQIGYAEYHLNGGGGGLALSKWLNAKTKLDPVIDELLSKKK